MEGSQFYLTLPSDSSMSMYPDNTMSDFTVSPPQPIELTGEWEVCLKEIQYPRTWNNVRKTQNHFYMKDSSGVPTVFLLQEGYYPSIDDILQGVKTSITDRATRDSVDMAYNRITRRVTITMTNGYSILLGEGLAVILGFGLKNNFIQNKTTAPNVVNLEGDLHSLFVYSDAIEAQVVGDSMVPTT